MSSQFLQENAVGNGWDKRVPCDADLVSLKDKMHFQACEEDHSTNIIHPISLEETSGEADDFTPLAFTKKVCRIVQIHWFHSIRWVDDSICVATDKKAFLK
ncbi:hypothetical protein QYF61_013883 [Mycteria americana]|uniref:Uncharacterized protein n=1 Tax=Mycteria americana TaxID=33587 RepID=A0AAN7N1Z9_MYCAM|nr:hypothetical protein QYF61_013883 [Mycteria americana]